VAFAFLLPILLIIGVLAGAWAILNDENDDPGTEVAQAPLVAAPSPTPTTESAVATQRDIPVDLTFSGNATREEATETAAPTLVPTDTPAPTQTPAPTDTPVPTLAPTQTPEPTLAPTEPLNPIEPIGAPAGDAESGSDLAIVDEAGNTGQIQRIGGGEESGAGESDAQTGIVSLDFTASDWQGAYFQATGNLQPWSAIYGPGSGYGSGTLRLDIPGQPASGTFTLTVQGMTSENWSSLPMAIQVNGREVYSGNSPFQTWNGIDGQQPWTSASFDLPADALQEGGNTITFINLAGEGAFGLPPYILLASGSITVEVQD
jgi:hypothetical protein